MEPRQATKRYYHGGFAGLKAGSYLLPPSEHDSPQKNLVDYIAEGSGYGSEYIRKDRVYVTTDKRAARAFAALKPHGALYEVEPVGDMEIDPDNTDGTSLMCPKARIIQVVDPLVRFEANRLAQYMVVLGG